MRLAIISSILHLPWGGADVLWTQLALAARSAGDDVFIMVSPIVASSPKIKPVTDAGAVVCTRSRHAVSTGKLAALRNWTEQLVKGSVDPIRSLLAFRPDLVVWNQGGAFDFLAEPQLIDAIRESNIPYALIAHSNDGTPLSSASVRARVHEVVSSAKTTAFVSRHNLQMAERQIAQSIKKSLIIQNPVRSPSEIPPWPESDVYRFATVSRLDAYDKGLDVLIPALAEAMGEIGGWTLDLYGNGESGPFLRDLISWCGLDGKVRLAGHSNSLDAIWRTHHLLLLPSRVEGCSLAMLEAMHHGRPVLATRVGGVDDWIIDSENGFVCDAPEQRCLADAVRRAWNVRERWQEMGAKARKTVLSAYDPTPVATLLEKLKTS